MKHSLVCGVLAPTCSGNARKVWNAIFSACGYDAFFDFYRSKSVLDLELRLSEMFVLERRGYILDPIFQESVIPLLDRLEGLALEKNRVDTVVNREGVLVGNFFDASPTDLQTEQRLSFWEFTA